MSDDVVEMKVGGKFLLLMGSLLVVTAVTILLLIGLLTYQIFYQPEQVAIVKYLMETIDLSDKAFFGKMNGENFYIHISDPIKYFLYFMATFLILSIVVKIFSSILSAGVKLIKAANASLHVDNRNNN